jgi:hypothetical protein
VIGADPPAELPVALHSGARRLAGGTIVVGGSPLRLVSLTERGARVLAGWSAPVPAPVGDAPGRRRLARRLLDAGLLTPHPAPEPSTAQLTVIVPARDRPAALARCLNAIAAACPDSPVIVVDDGSADPASVRAACAARGARLLVGGDPEPRGPAAARNRGLAACRTPYAAFVDSDVVLEPGSARALLGHLADSSLAAVAPRVRALGGGGGGIVAGYEARHSALDMGDRGGLVGPGRRTSYVPATVLVARREALGDGFQEALRTG